MYTTSLHVLRRAAIASDACAALYLTSDYRTLSGSQAPRGSVECKKCMARSNVPARHRQMENAAHAFYGMPDSAAMIKECFCHRANCCYSIRL